MALRPHPLLRVRLRTRIVLWFASLVVLEGLVAALSITHLVGLELRASARRAGASTTQSLLLQSMDPVLTGNPVELYKLLRRAMSGSPDVRYAFVLDRNGNVLAHTFARGVPEPLLTLHPLDRPDEPRLVEYGEEPLYDFSAVAEWGAVRVGISLAGVERSLSHTRAYVLGATAAGVLAAVVLALWVSRPVERLTQFVASATAAGGADLDPEVLSTLETSELCEAFERVNRQLRQKVAELTASERTIRGQKEYIENLHDSLGLAICVVTPEGSIEFANERARSRLGAVGGSRSWLERFEALDEKGPALRDAIAEQAPFQGLWRTPDGTAYDIKGVPIRSIGGSPSVLLRFLDVSEEIALREQLERSQKMAYAGTLAASIAHGVNNPLGAAIMKAEMLVADARQAGVPDRFVAEVEKIRALATRAGSLTQRLLLFSRHSAEEFPLRTRPADLAELARQAASHLEEKARAQGTQVALEASESVSLEVDPEGILHALINVLDNAIDAAGPGGSVRLEVGRHGDGSAFARVRDDGPGMSEDLMAKIFTPFFTTKQVQGGTGLGLAISELIVKQHGGRIAVGSRPGHGTTVTILLPPRPSEQSKE
ncbi:MAG: hypothetical protein D6815_00670 [Candidatus Dadabacteria bacterium]|nr:MAG: hypothetical protein D6815_00670 [Candidatus Dadabacteria bacterium]